MPSKTKRHFLTVMGKDQAGIISTVTSCLQKSKANLEDVSMTVLEGQFAMMLILSSSVSAEKLDQKLKAAIKPRKLCFFWQSVSKGVVRGEKHAKGSETYLVTAAGRDRTGIVAAVSQVLAKRRLNITDLNSKILGSGKNTIYVMMLEFDAPRKMKLSSLKASFGRLSKKLKIEISIRALERFEF